jgi:hypothetical protein
MPSRTEWSAIWTYVRWWVAAISWLHIALGPIALKSPIARQRSEARRAMVARLSGAGRPVSAAVSHPTEAIAKISKERPSGIISQLRGNVHLFQPTFHFQARHFQQLLPIFIGQLFFKELFEFRLAPRRSERIIDPSCKLPHGIAAVMIAPQLFVMRLLFGTYGFNQPVSDFASLFGIANELKEHIRRPFGL